MNLTLRRVCLRSFQAMCNRRFNICGRTLASYFHSSAPCKQLGVSKPVVHFSHHYLLSLNDSHESVTTHAVNLELPSVPTWMSLGCGRKPEDLDRTHTGRGRTHLAVGQAHQKSTVHTGQGSTSRKRLCSVFNSIFQNNHMVFFFE